MRRRTAQLGIQASFKRSGATGIVVSMADTAGASTAQEELGKSAELDFYDWETNVIGPTGAPMPADGVVTGDATSTGPGGVTSGLLEYQAVLHAAKRPPIVRSNDTTLTPGCTAAQIGKCLYGTWYLLGNGEQVLRGPSSTRGALFSEGYEAPGRATAVRVNPGTVLVQAYPLESAKGQVVDASPNSWYVLNDDPALSGADIVDPMQSFEEVPGQPALPNIVFGFTPEGKRAFERITKAGALRGRHFQDPGVSVEEAMQHFAVVLEGQILTVPSINYSKYPNGIKASTGSQITGDFTAFSAQALAGELRSGALPLRLTLISGSHPPAA
jgi:SecD/SecF fusion protein